MAADIHRSALVFDAHADTPQRLLDELSDGLPWDFVTSPLGTGSLHLESARRGHLAAQFFALWVDPSEFPPRRHAHRALELLDAVFEQIRRNPAELRLCLTPDDILAARAGGLFAVVLAIEGGHAIENSLALLRLYYRLGVRMMTLTWSHTTDWADSSGDIDNPTVAHHDGLSPFGRQVIAEMNRLGMIVDVSHVSDKTLTDVLEISSAPVLASHSSARALTHAPRNLTDDQLRAIRDSGGAVMVNFYSAFIDESFRLALNALKAEREAAHAALAAPYRAAGKPVPFFLSNAIDRDFAARIPRPPLSALIDHFEHIVHVGGIDHVGLGSDFDGISSSPAGIDSAADLPKITEALVQRGFTAEDLHKLLGGNLLRVFRDVQAAAQAAVQSTAQLTSPPAP